MVLPCCLSKTAWFYHGKCKKKKTCHYFDSYAKIHNFANYFSKMILPLCTCTKHGIIMVNIQKQHGISMVRIVKHHGNICKNIIILSRYMSKNHDQNTWYCTYRKYHGTTMLFMYHSTMVFLGMSMSTYIYICLFCISCICHKNFHQSTIYIVSLTLYYFSKH